MKIVGFFLWCRRVNAACDVVEPVCYAHLHNINFSVIPFHRERASLPSLRGLYCRELKASVHIKGRVEWMGRNVLTQLGETALLRGSERKFYKTWGPFLMYFNNTLVA